MFDEAQLIAASTSNVEKKPKRELVLVSESEQPKAVAEKHPQITSEVQSNGQRVGTKKRCEAEYPQELLVVQDKVGRMRELSLKSPQASHLDALFLPSCDDDSFGDSEYALTTSSRYYNPSPVTASSYDSE